MSTPTPWDPVQEAGVTDEEIEFGRVNTLAFIGANPVSIEVTRPTYSDDGAGGKVQTGSETLLPQVVRMVPQGEIAGPGITGGRLSRYDYVLVGDTDVDIQRGDVFAHLGRKVRVEYIIDPLPYETRAGVSSAT